MLEGYKWKWSGGNVCRGVGRKGGHQGWNNGAERAQRNDGAPRSGILNKLAEIGDEGGGQRERRGGLEQSCDRR